MMKNYQNQTGRSMIEMLGVLAIIGVLSVGGIVGYSKAMQKQKLNTTRNQIAHIVAGVKRYYLTQGSFAGLTTEVAKNAGIIPDEMATSGTGDQLTITNAYGGTIIVEVDPDNTGDNSVFGVAITGLPKEVAVDIGTGAWNDDGSLQEVEIKQETNNP